MRAFAAIRGALAVGALASATVVGIPNSGCTTCIDDGTTCGVGTTFTLPEQLSAFIGSTVHACVNGACADCIVSGLATICTNGTCSTFYAPADSATEIRCQAGDLANVTSDTGHGNLTVNVSFAVAPNHQDGDAYSATIQGPNPFFQLGYHAASVKYHREHPQGPACEECDGGSF